MCKQAEVLKLWLTLMEFPKAYAVLRVLVGGPLDQVIAATNEALQADPEPVQETPPAPGVMAMNGAGSIFIDDKYLWWSTERVTQAQYAQMQKALDVVNSIGAGTPPP